MKDPKQIVRDGYDNLAARYREHFRLAHQHDYNSWIEEFISHVPKGMPVLELGCGDGVPVAEQLSKQFSYTGVDLSMVQLAAAKQNVPMGDFQLTDMTLLDFPENTFGGIVAFYSVIHVPVSEQKKLMTSIYRWLQPGGYFLCTLGTHEWTGTETNWIAAGTTMYWSHSDANTYRDWFIEIGFKTVRDEFIKEAENGHTYFLLRK